MPIPGGSGLVPNSPLLTEEALTSLGNSSTRNVGTTAGTVAAGDDARFGAGGSPLVGRTLKAATRWYLVGNPARVTNAQPNEAWELSQRFVASRSTTLTSIAVKVTTAGSTGALVRIAVKAEDANGLPGAVLAQGTIDPTTTGIKTLAVSVSVTAGTGYFISTATQGAATTRPIMECVSGDGGDPDIGSDTSSNAFADWVLAYSTNSAAVTGAMGTLSSWGTIGTAPRKMISAAT